ncbi:hypothetical protein ACGFX8_29090 [Streptomyces sp. NPDC048362]|uniref:hypothetical protein n=1 Tax=Streptomyces sp. NPDC048362 TaxID=3365539 RepID=UPI00371A49B5
MEHTSSTRAVAGTAGLGTLAGIGTTLLGVLHHDLPMVVGGTCSALTTLVIFALVLVHRWITDTSDERRVLAASQRAAQSQRDHYFAARVALENEQCRLRQEMNTERHHIATTLAKEWEAMSAAFEEKRATLIAETMEATVLMYRNGEFAPATPSTGQLIPFPTQERQAGATERARPREHEVGAP